MIRTQVTLTEEQMARLRAEALRRGVSIAAVVRAAVDREVRGEEWVRRKARALDAVGCVDEDRPDVAERHDQVLAEVIGGRAAR